MILALLFGNKHQKNNYQVTRWLFQTYILREMKKLCIHFILSIVTFVQDEKLLVQWKNISQQQQHYFYIKFWKGVSQRNSSRFSSCYCGFRVLCNYWPMQGCLCSIPLSAIHHCSAYLLSEYKQGDNVTIHLYCNNRLLY